MNASTEPHTNELLSRAVQAARNGQLDEARDLAKSGVSNGGEQAVQFHAFLGMIEARSGNNHTAADHLHRAHALRPKDVTIACNLMTVLVDSGMEADALMIATANFMHADDSLRIARMRGFLSQQAGHFEEAVEAYEYVLSCQSDDFECLNNLGNARAAIEDHEGAIEVLQRALEIDANAAPTYLNLASAFSALERYDEASRVLETASDRFPDDSRPPHQLYLLHKGQLNQGDAIAALEKAAKRAPNDAEKQLALGAEYGVVRDTVKAEQAYRNAIKLAPTELDAYLGLAIQYEHSNRENEFAPLLEEARACGIAIEPLAFIEALELRRQKRFDEALARLDRVPNDIEPIRTVHMRATLLDRLGRTDEAFDAYTRANALMQESPTDPVGRAADLRCKLQQELNLLTPKWRDCWVAAPIADQHPAPVFLLGFPRSGTTLLDTFLMGHSDVVVMEEQPPLNIVEEALGGFASIPKLDEEAIAEARARYFEEVSKIVDLPPSAVLIDKSPLFLYRLPLIKRLFPDAKIILALRHPCDVVLSCFMSNFRLNTGMSNFLRLEDAAAFYDVCFRHWAASRTLFDVDVYTINYEKLVESTERELRKLIDWLGLDWSDGLLDHTTTARSRGLITTASYSQVVEPIYRRASGRWLRYRSHLEPIFEKLRPWAKEFGYGDPSQASRNPANK